MSDQEKPEKQNVHAEDNSIAVGSISVDGDVSGNIHIGHTTGYTAEQVSVLIAQIKSTFQSKPFDGRCPYKGLDVFEEEDAELFFGREKLVDDLVSRVKDSQTVFVTGPSGSGKSSLVRAGLMHALKQGKIKGSERWLYATMKPGRDPIGELGRVVSSLASSTNPEDEIRAKAMKDAAIFARWCEIALKEGRDKRVVLFIDQFEEVFTQINKEEERVAFLNLLTHAATIENGRVIILFSMRSDFVSNCATYPQLNALLNQQFVQIGAMQPEELVSAIAQPALRVGLRIDPDLIAQIINEMKGEPGALPLMQFALKDLFDSQGEKSGVIALTLNDYLQRGGIHKALERHADDSFSKLSNHEQELARSIFSGLIEIGRGTQDTRRTALFDELVPANTNAADVESIVQKLADARLITTDEQAGKDTVTISHEKLIDAWPWLKKLVNENRDVIALQNQIAADAKEWEEHKRDASYLYSGGRLANVREQVEKQKLTFNHLAQEFVRTAKVRQRGMQAFLIAAVSVVLIAAIVASVVFQNQAQTNIKIANTAQAASTEAVAQQVTAQANAEEAQRQAKISRAGELTMQSIEIRENNFQISLLLGIDAFNSWDTVRSRGALLDVTNTNPRVLQFFTGHTSWVYSVAFSPDGKTLSSGSQDNTIILWDVATGLPIGRPLTGHTSGVRTVTFSPDGKTLASGSDDKTIILWEVSTGKPIGQPLTGNTSRFLAFSPDGKTLASGGGDNSIILWDVATRQPIGQPLLSPDSIFSVAFSPDGKTLASSHGDFTIILWDVATHQPIGQPLKSAGYVSIAFSPNGKILASSGSDTWIHLWDVATGQPIGQLLTGDIRHTGSVTSIAFSPDGKTLASGSDDDSIILWDVATRLPIQKLIGHTDSVTSVAFSPDGKTLASGSGDQTIILWDIAKDLSIRQSFTGHTSSVYAVAFSPDGKTLASGSGDSTIILWDVATRQLIGQPLTGHTYQIYTIAFSPDGKTLASGSGDNTIILWDVATHQPIGQPLKGQAGYVSSVAFSPDGKILASGYQSLTTILWDVNTHQPIGQPLVGGRSNAFSPDLTIASISYPSEIILMNMETGKSIGQPLTGFTGDISSMAFNPNGKILASASSNGSIILWDVGTHQAIGQPLTGPITGIYTVAFSPDGKTLASAGGDGTIMLWDVATRQLIGKPLTGNNSRSLAFSPDGKTLASGSTDNTIILWDLDPQSWIEKSCQRVGRNFMRSEWEKYFPDEDYRKTCDQWPLELEATATSTATP